MDRAEIGIPAWWWDEHGHQLSGAALKLVLAVARHGSPTFAHGRRSLRLAASHAALARLAGIARSSVPAACGQLVDAGLLSLPRTDPGAPSVLILHLDPDIPPGWAAQLPDGFPPDLIDRPVPKIGTHHHEDDVDLPTEPTPQHQQHDHDRPSFRAAAASGGRHASDTRQKLAATRAQPKTHTGNAADALAAMDKAGVTHPDRWLSRWSPERIAAALEHANAVGARNPAGMAYYLLTSNARLQARDEVRQWNTYDSPLYRQHLAARASLQSPRPSASTS
jgi:hypothetical protein